MISSVAGASTEKLQERVDDLRPRIGELRRSFLIEFTGTPKAGKTTCVDAIAKFFRRNRVPVSLVTERASVCPVTDKSDVFFNVWTASTSLAQMVAALQADQHVVVLDRGLFDSLVWMNYHRERSALNKSDFTTIERFLTLSLITRPIDIVVALRSEPQVSLDREFKDQITDLPGKIMNKDVLSAYNRALEESIAKYRDNFRTIIQLDTTSLQPVDGVQEIAEQLLETAAALLDEDIAYVPRAALGDFFQAGDALESPSSLKQLLARSCPETGRVRCRKRQMARCREGADELAMRHLWLGEVVLPD